MTPVEAYPLTVKPACGRIGHTMNRLVRLDVHLSCSQLLATTGKSRLYRQHPEPGLPLTPNQPATSQRLFNAKELPEPYVYDRPRIEHLLNQEQERRQRNSHEEADNATDIKRPHRHPLNDLVQRVDLP